MSQDSNSKTSNKDKASLSKATTTHLRLVVSNSVLPQHATPSQTPHSNTDVSFSVDVRVKGPGLYEMVLQDPSHYLKCDLTLEVEERYQEYEGRTVICHFPTLSDQELNDFMEEDETLHDMIMVQFHMKILEQLFLFCATHDAATLVIFADDVQADDLGVYQDFLAYEDQTLTATGEKTEMVIPTDRKTFDAWIDFMQNINTEFHQALWRDQSSNPIIRQYLKRQCAKINPHEGQEAHNAQ